MSNLNDYNYSIPTTGNKPFVYNRFKDQGFLRADPSAPGVMPPIDWVVGEQNPLDKECNRSFTLGRDLTSWADA